MQVCPLVRPEEQHIYHNDEWITTERGTSVADKLMSGFPCKWGLREWDVIEDLDSLIAIRK